MSSVGQDLQPASQQGNCSYSGGLLPLVIDLEESSETPVGVASTTTSSVSAPQTIEQPSKNLTDIQSHVEPVDVCDDSTAPLESAPLESTVSTELSATTGPDTREVAFDLTVTRQPCPVTTEASAGTADDSVVFISQTPATVLSEEYQTRYEKYENLCTLITLKDRELAELNDERKRLHQLLVELQHAILTRPMATTVAPVDASSTAPTNVTEVVTDKERDRQKEESKQERADVTTASAAAAYRRRPAHRGVTSVRVMVKSTQPPTAHSTKINLLRYNSLFCNYDDAVGRRKPSTEVVVVSEDAVSSISATDLTTSGSERTTKCTDLAEEVAQPPVSAAPAEEPCPAKDATTSFLHMKGEKGSENVDVGYMSEARSTTQGRRELVQYQRHPIDVCQTSTALELSLPHRDTAVQNSAISCSGRTAVAYTVPDDAQRIARQIMDAARHQQFVVATTNEMIMSTARFRREVDDQRSDVLATLRPEMSLVMSSPGKLRSSGAAVEVSSRSMCERRELRPPPPYPHHLPPGLPPPEHAAGIQISRSQLEHSAAHVAAAYICRKENSAGQRTGYVQPMRAENQASVVVPLGSSGREMDDIGNRLPCSDISPKGQPVSEAVFLGNRVSPPAIPLRVGPVRPAYDQTYYLLHATSDMTQPQPRNNDSYHGNLLSNPQTSDAVPQQLVLASAPGTTNVEQWHVTMTSSSGRDVINRYQADPRALDQLQHFVGIPQFPPGQQSLDVGDPRLRRLSPPSPRSMTSVPLNNVDGRSHGPAVGGYYSQEDTAIDDLTRRGAALSSYPAQTGHSPRFLTGTLPPPPSLRRDPNPLRPRPPRVQPHSATGQPAVAPLDMSGPKRRRYSLLNQSDLKAIAEQQRMAVVSGSAAPVIGPRYPRLITHDRSVAPRPEVLRRPGPVEPLRHYIEPIHPDAVTSVSSLANPQDVHGLSRAPRGPPVRVMEHQASSMRCETCSRPAMFVCSACRKAAYCSVDCQAKAWRLRHGAVCRRLVA